MSWESVILAKALPKNRQHFAKIVQSDVRFPRLVRRLESTSIGSSSLIKEVLRELDDGRLNITILQSLAPEVEYPTDKLEANIETLKQIVNYKDSNTNLKEIKEGLSLLDKRKDGNLTEAEEKRLNLLFKEITTMKIATGHKNRKLVRETKAARNTFLRNFGGFVLTFKGTLDDLGNKKHKKGFKKDLQSLAKTRVTTGQPPTEQNLGTVSDETIITVFDSGQEFINYVKENQQFRENAYNVYARKHNPNLTGLGSKVENSEKAKLQEMHSKNVVFSAEKIDTITEVNTYFSIIAELSGSKGLFIPKQSKKGTKTAYLPPSIFLLKNDANTIQRKTQAKQVSGGKGTNVPKMTSNLSSLRLNPYANRILLSGFTEDSWFADLFGIVKRDLTTDTEANKEFYEDVTLVYENKKPTYVESGDFSGLENLSENIETRKRQIDKFIKDNGLTQEKKEAIDKIKQGRFAKDAKTLPIKEAKKVQEFWDRLTEETIDDFDYLGTEDEPFDVMDNEEEGIGELRLVEKENQFAIKYRDRGEPKFSDISATELMGILGQFGMEQQENLRRVRNFLSREENFKTYLQTLSSEEIKQAVSLPSGSRAYMDRIDPLNGLAYLSNINEYMYGRDNAGVIKETLLAIASEEEPSAKANLINRLDEKMLPMIRDMTKFLFEAIQERLEYIGKEYLKASARSQEKSVLMALKMFKEKGLLSGGEEL